MEKTNKPLMPASWPFEIEHNEHWAFWDNCFTPDECAKIIEIGESLTPETAHVGGKGELLKTRDSRVSWIHPNQDTAWIFRRLTEVIVGLNSQYFHFDLYGLIEGLQFTKYEAPAGFYGKHIDVMRTGRIRKLSVTVQLSHPDDYDGGNLELHFGDTPQVPDKSFGRLVAFPSFVLHEVTPVTRGTRYSLVAWVTGPSFK